MIETKEWRTIDKSKWLRGEWDTEPDKMQWSDEATGLPCLIVRGPLGALCGYVGVPKSHPFYGVDYGDCSLGIEGERYCSHSPQHFAEVHGGLTFADRCHPHEDGEGRGICHVAPEGEDDVWWLGFDCAHGDDLMPGRNLDDHGVYRGYGGSVYRDLDYVRRECRNLARQMAAVATPAP